MRFLHTMVRVHDLDAALKFFGEGLGLIEARRMESAAGRFTLVYLAALLDKEHALSFKAPELELTYNWPDADGKAEVYTGGRNSAISPMRSMTSMPPASALPIWAW